MVNANTNLVDLLMPLAERMLPAVGYDSEGGGAPERPDPRFEALRWPIENDEGGGWRIETSLGAILRAVAACGFEITYLASPDSPSNPSRMWACSMTGGGGGFTTPGENPEEAMARAMVELLDLTERWGVTV